MAGKTTIANSETKLEALKLQSSAYGVTLPVVYGVTRIPGNLLWYGGFQAIATTTTEESGKGGGVKVQSTSYRYEAAVMMGLCEGDITGVGRVWVGKKLYEGGPDPAAIVSTTQDYTVPSGGGVCTVTHVATFASNGGVTGPVTVEGESGTYTYTGYLGEGADYSRVGGTYTFGAQWSGVTLTISYQYIPSGADQSSLQQLGLSFAPGTVGQATWSYLTTNHSAQALGYSGIAYCYSSAYDLGTSASIENHNFEIQAQYAYALGSTVPDVDPSRVGYDITTNYRYGVPGFPAARLGSTDAWSSYARAAGLLMSPAFTEQRKAAEVLKDLTDLTNTALVWSEGLLKFIPYGDQALTGNGATFTPNVTPAYDLTDDHFLDREKPIRQVRKPQADAWNQVQVEFLNRANQYNIEVAEAKDQANIDTYGLRSAPTLKAHWIADAGVARNVAQLRLQRALYVRNEYEFRLPWTFALLEPMDLVTLTDPGLELDRQLVRIIEVSEDEGGDLQVRAEDCPLGIASAPLYASQSGAGYSHNYNVAPGSVEAPVIFEAPAALTVNGLEVYVAATGLDANWGGCHVWVSLDGSNYKQTGTISGGSRYGTLTAAAGASGGLALQLKKGTLASGTAADSAALNTLCFVGGAAPEFLAYETATLTSALQYTLGGSMTRGAYSTAAAAHASGSPFVRVDTGVAKSGPIDLGYIGRTIRVKLTSFNIYGGGEQSLADVPEYTYTITGAMVGLVPGFAGRGVSINASALTFQISKTGTTTPGSITLTAVLTGTLSGTVMWSIVAGTGTLSGTTGAAITVAAVDMVTDTLSVRATVTDSVGTYTADVTLVKVREGLDGQTATLTPESVVFPADAAGNVTNYGPGVATFRVWVGGVDDTANWTVTRSNSAGVSSTLSGTAGNVLTVTSMDPAQDTGYVDITATRAGDSPMAKRLSLSKSKAGADGFDFLLVQVFS